MRPPIMGGRHRRLTDGGRPGLATI